MSNIYEGLSPSENPQTYAHPTDATVDGQLAREG